MRGDDYSIYEMYTQECKRYFLSLRSGAQLLESSKYLMLIAVPAFQTLPDLMVLAGGVPSSKNRGSLHVNTFVAGSIFLHDTDISSHFSANFGFKIGESAAGEAVFNLFSYVKMEEPHAKGIIQDQDDLLRELRIGYRQTNMEDYFDDAT